MRTLRPVACLWMAWFMACPQNVFGASHREAPITALDQKADITDFYAFVSYDDPYKVTFILNVDPFLEPSNGPNYFPFDPNILYAIRIDNNQDANQDVAFEFRFQTEIRAPGVFTGFVGVGEGVNAPAGSPAPHRPQGDADLARAVAGGGRTLEHHLQGERVVLGEVGVDGRGDPGEGAAPVGQMPLPRRGQRTGAGAPGGEDRGHPVLAAAPDRTGAGGGQLGSTAARRPPDPHHVRRPPRPAAEGLDGAVLGADDVDPALGRVAPPALEGARVVARAEQVVVEDVEVGSVGHGGALDRRATTLRRGPDSDGRLAIQDAASDRSNERSELFGASWWTSTSFLIRR